MQWRFQDRHRGVRVSIYTRYVATYDGGTSKVDWPDTTLTISASESETAVSTVG